jgi:flagellar FliL protein
MSDDVKSEDEDLTDGLAQKKISGKKIMIFAVIGILLLGGGGAAFMMLGGDDKVIAADGAEQADASDNETEKEPTELLFYSLEPMVVNLNTASGGNKFMKITVTLEVDKQSSIEVLEKKLPRIIDRFQTFLREMRLEDINGAAGSFRLKEELLTRVNEAVYPVKVNDVLLQQIQVTG